MDTDDVTISVDTSATCGTVACVQPNPVPNPTQVGNTVTFTFPANPQNLLTQLQYRIKPNQAGSVPDMGTRIASAGETSKSFNIQADNCGLQYQARVRYQCAGNTFGDWKFKTFNTVACGNKLASPEAFATIDLYPNPADDQILLHYNSIMEERVQIEIFDMLGKRLLQKEEQVMKGENVVFFDLSEFVSGVYIMQVKGIDGEVLKRFVVER